MSFHLLDDIRKLLDSSAKSKDARINTLKVLFVFIGICMAGVGIFTYAQDPLMHNLSAYSMVLGFAIIIIGLKKILPFIDPTFLANSYFTLLIIAICYYLFAKVHYLNLTAFELIAFGITFAWLVLFVRKITSLRTNK
jgi:type IV secretory pathway VirB3-like protein